jgi:hypothetical protein
MNKPTLRKNEIAEKYLIFLDGHIDDVINGKEQEFFSIKYIASYFAISHTHFTDSIKLALGHHPCFFYDDKIIEKAKELLVTKKMLPADVARKLTYDPSNFSKFFKRWTGETPGAYKASHQIE